jgi:hypothetical protein
MDNESRMKRMLWTLMGVGVVVAIAKRGQRARQIYVEEVSSGAKPIQAVGTAVAAFVGLAPGTP